MTGEATSPQGATPETVARECVSCGLCRRECAFLQKYGLPGEQAEEALAGTLDPGQPFLCSLCGLCSEICPVEIDPAGMFAGLRCRAVSSGGGCFRQHTPLLSYERWGRSTLLTWYGLPEGCETVFFPGCALPGTRPGRVLQVLERLGRDIPALGVVLDCCSKPSHDLGRREVFQASFARVLERLHRAGVKRVLVACPNCYRMFAGYGQGLEVRTIYELLPVEKENTSLRGEVTVHDPCGVREQEEVHRAVRGLIRKLGLTVREMPHHGTRTVCCGEGGAVGYLDGELAGTWTGVRAAEADGRRIMTYCAGCTYFLGRRTPTSHVLDLLFDPATTLQGRESVARSPRTWWNRLLLKCRLVLGRW